MSANPPLSELREGDEVTGTYAVTSSTLRSTRRGAPYLALRLQDATGEIEARLWRKPEVAPTPQHFACVVGQVDSYQGERQLVLDELEVLDSVEDEELERLFPTCLPSPDFYFDKVEFEVEAMADGPYKCFCQVLLGGEFGGRLKRAPAARRNHHARVGGLIQHCWSMICLARQAFVLYGALHPGALSWPLLVAGILCHDLGKVVELYPMPGQGYTHDGAMLGHIFIGATIAEQLADEAIMPIEERIALLHLILSHHGRLDWGSPVEPKRLEALLLHQVDLLDSRMDAALHLAVGPDGWTEDRALGGAKLYRGVR